MTGFFRKFLPSLVRKCRFPSLSDRAERCKKLSWGERHDAGADVFGIGRGSKMMNLFDLRGFPGPGNSSSVHPYTTVITATDEDKFLIEKFDVLMDDLLEHTSMEELPEVRQLYRQALTHSLLGGRRFGPHAVLRTVNSLSSSRSSAKKVSHEAAMTAWCTELMLRSNQMNGDLIRGTHTRGSTSAWHKKNDVGLRAVYDGQLLQRSVFFLLWKHCRHLETYTELTNLFHDVALGVAFGETLDSLSFPRECTLSSEWLDQKHMQTVMKYRNLTQYVRLPVTAGMLLSEFDDRGKRNAVLSLTTKIGRYAQFVVQYLNAFGDLEATLEIGNDIQNGRCTWLIAAAWDQANEAQRRVLIDCYGCRDDDCVKRVRDMFYDLDVPLLYHQISDDFRGEIVKDLADLMDIYEDPRIHVMITSFFDLVHWYLYHSKTIEPIVSCSNNGYNNYLR